MPLPTREQLKELEKLSIDILTPEGYELLVKYCANNKINLPLSNGHWKHATILLKEFFFTGKDHVFILSGELYMNAFDDSKTIEYASKFIQKGGEVHIAFTNKINYDNMLNRPFVKSLIKVVKDAKSSMGNRAFILKDASSVAPSANHFMAVDGRGFRFETDHAHSIAIANFDQPEIAGRLETAFKDIFRQSTPVYPDAEKIA